MVKDVTLFGSPIAVLPPTVPRPSSPAGPAASLHLKHELHADALDLPSRSRAAVVVRASADGADTRRAVSQHVHLSSTMLVHGHDQVGLAALCSSVMLSACRIIMGNPSAVCWSRMTVEECLSAERELILGIT